MGNRNSRLKVKTKTPELDLAGLVDLLDQEKELAHYLSNGADSIDRVHMYHFFKRYLFQSNFSSPVEDNLIKGNYKVLDVGCGPGTWLLDLSNKYGNSNFLGVDIKPIFPKEIKPNNVEFIEADIFDGLSFSDEEFDFVHIDSMSLILTADQWDFILSEIVRVTKPGGYIEVADKRNQFDNAGPIFHKIMEGFFTSYSKRDVDLKLIFNLDSKIKLLPNIENVHRYEKKAIVGPNGGKIGLVFQDLAIAYFTTDMGTEVLSGELGISKKDFTNMVKKDLIDELKQTSPENIQIRFWAQKN